MSDDIIDETFFNQLLDMDDGDGEFVKSIISSFINEQVIESFEKFDQLLEESKLLNGLELEKINIEIGELGHFLKGSSGQIGALKMKEISEEIQKWEDVFQGHFDMKDEIYQYFKTRIDSLKIAFKVLEYEFNKRLTELYG